MASAIRITQRKSSNGARPRQRETLRTLGLRRVGSTVERSDGPALRGMIRAVAHLVTVSEGSRAGSRARRTTKAATSEGSSNDHSQGSERGGDG